MATHIRNVVEAVDIPIFADGDTGHCSVTNVIRTTREFEKAGVAGFLLKIKYSRNDVNIRKGNKSSLPKK
jgi:isocitrate lyase